MPVQLASINSGSNGNCYYIGNSQAGVLVDAGISCRMTERRMMRMGLPMSRVQAIFITHEHTDHTRGAEVLSRKYGIPVYISERTYRQSRMNLEPSLTRWLVSDAPVSIGGIEVTPFRKSHDASDPHSVTVSVDGVTVGVFTDIGVACDRVVYYMNQCHAVFLESNYDEGMLDRGRYPLYLKSRIRSDQGHLSNRQALELFLNHRHPALSLLILSHLSAENNHPQIVYNLFSANAYGIKVVVASRYEESEIFNIHTG
ncbi:MAG TPA: MBL fold metallo-hydrolase [Bacteroidales bacterium]|nr:MBL fold metallo-hydrolase [Bacteroidales bacterium]